MNIDPQLGFGLGDWKVYPTRNLLVGPPGEIHIEPKVMQVLASLASKPGKVVERDWLLNELWDGRAFSDEPLTRCIAALRHTLGDSPKDPAYIQTIPKSGYRLVCPVKSLEQETDSANVDFGEPSDTRNGRLITDPRRIALPAFLGLIFVATSFLFYRSTLINTAESPQLTVEGTARSELSVNSIAVLPFVNMSSDPEREYFSDAMTEVLTGELGRIKALKVISRTSAMHYKTTDKLLPEIARELGVDALLEGSVLPVGDEVRITLHLVHGATDRQLWSKNYERDLRDVLVLQADVTRDIAEEIRITLTPQTEIRLARAQTVDSEAYQLWLKGTFYLGKLDEESFRKGLASFQEAIDRDTSYAPAYAGLAMAYTGLGSWHASVPPQEVHPLAKEAAERALALDPTVSEAHFAFALILRMFEWDWEGADRAYMRGIALKSNDTTFGRIFYANFLTAMGRFEKSIEIGRRTLELDPLSPAAYNELGFALWFSGRYDEALELYRDGLKIDPDFPQSHFQLGASYVMRGDIEKGLTHLALLDRGELSPSNMGLLGLFYGLAGQPIKARDYLSQLLERRSQAFVPASALARIYLGLGEHDEALQWLETAYGERDVSLVWLKEASVYDRLRPDPRFQIILDRLDFPGA